MPLRLAKEADRLYLEEHVRHGSRENRRREGERVHTFLDWVEINIKGVTNLRRLGKITLPNFGRLIVISQTKRLTNTG